MHIYVYIGFSLDRIHVYMYEYVVFHCDTSERRYGHDLDVYDLRFALALGVDEVGM